MFGNKNYCHTHRWDAGHDQNISRCMWPDSCHGVTATANDNKNGCQTYKQLSHKSWGCGEYDDQINNLKYKNNYSRQALPYNNNNNNTIDLQTHASSTKVTVTNTVTLGQYCTNNKPNWLLQHSIQPTDFWNKKRACPTRSLYDNLHGKNSENNHNDTIHKRTKPKQWRSNHSIFHQQQHRIAMISLGTRD